MNVDEQWQPLVTKVVVMTENKASCYLISRGVARNMFWGGISFLGRYKILILMFNYRFDVIFTP